MLHSYLDIVNPLSPKSEIQSKIGASSFHTTPLSQSGTCAWVWMHSSACVCAFLFPLFNPRQLAERHYNLFLLRRSALGWQQSAKESLSEKEASADQLYQHFLLRKSLSCWKRVCIHKRTHTLKHTVNHNCSLPVVCQWKAWFRATPLPNLLFLHSIMFKVPGL